MTEKICVECGSKDNKFKNCGKKCIKCYSKKNNTKLKENNYYKNYYQNKKNV